MKKVEFIINNDLQAFVNCIMTDESDVANSHTSIPLYADGYPGIMFQQSENGLYLLPKKKKLSELFLYGQTLDPVSLDIEGKYKCIVLICPILTLSLATVLNYDTASSLVFTLFLMVTAIYLLGVFIITILGNIPLNNFLDKSDLEYFSLEDAKNLRNEIETKWNNFNLIRTITSLISFIVMIIICFLVTI